MKVQALIRGQQSRRVVEERKEEIAQALAARWMQAYLRGKRARQAVQAERERQEQMSAARRLQRAARNKSARSQWTAVLPLGPPLVLPPPAAVPSRRPPPVPPSPPDPESACTRAPPPAVRGGWVPTRLHLTNPFRRRGAPLAACSRVHPEPLLPDVKQLEPQGNQDLPTDAEAKVAAPADPTNRVPEEPKTLEKPPKFKKLPALLRVPNPQNILGVTFSSSLINSSCAVLGAQVGEEYALEPEDAWLYGVAWLVTLSIIFWYVHQVMRLERMRRRFKQIWSDSEPPASVKECDDPLFMLLMKLGFKPRMRLTGEFGTPDSDVEEPARTERALAYAFFWATRAGYVCGCSKRSMHAVGTYGKKQLSCFTCTCCETQERPGDAMERSPAWLDEARGGQGTHYLVVQLGLQLFSGAVSGFLEASSRGKLEVWLPLTRRFRTGPISLYSQLHNS